MYLAGELKVIADALSRICGVDASDEIGENICSSLEQCLEVEQGTECEHILSRCWKVI